jgi:hypothetical protein
MSTNARQSGSRDELPALPVSRARSEPKRRGNGMGASEGCGRAFLLEQSLGAQPPPAWAAHAPLLPGEAGVHIASRLGIVAVEAPSESDATCGSHCCRRRENGPACSTCRVNTRHRTRDGGDAP